MIFTCWHSIHVEVTVSCYSATVWRRFVVNIDISFVDILLFLLLFTPFHFVFCLNLHVKKYSIIQKISTWIDVNNWLSFDSLTFSSLSLTLYLFALNRYNDMSYTICEIITLNVFNRFGLSMVCTRVLGFFTIFHIKPF